MNAGFGSLLNVSVMHMESGLSSLALNKKTMTQFLDVPLKPAESLNISDVLSCFS